MRSAATAPAFGFVPTGHPLRPDFERFWDAAAEVPGLRRALAAPATVRSVLRMYPDGRTLKWICMSVQRQTADGFSSLTLHYRSRKRRLAIFELPDDPFLPSLPVAEEVDGVLQYIPRHRFAFRTRGPRREIGKCVRATDVEAAWLRLNAVWDAALRADAGFAVADPRRLDRKRSAFYQAELPGLDLAGLVDERNGGALFRRAGAVHAGLQSLDVRGLPSWDAREFLARLDEHARLVCLFRPDAAAVVRGVLAILWATTPGPGRTAFCHGDLRSGHLLVDDGAWSVIDFDGCHVGDPCQDVARLLAFLKRDVPYLRDRFAAPDGGHAELDSAIDAFLEGHAEQAGAELEPARLTWYLAAHELHFLARMFKRDLYDAIAFERSLERLVTLRELLLDRLGGRRRP
jgi:hypothetical protein